MIAGNKPDAADARNHGYGDHVDGATVGQLHGERVARAVLVVALRIGSERASYYGATPTCVGRIGGAQHERIPQRTGRVTVQPEPGEELAAIVRTDPGMAKPGPQDMHHGGLAARPADPRHALAVHPGPVAAKGGRLEIHALPGQAGVGIDAEPRGVAGGLHAQHEPTGGLVEVGVPGGVGGRRVGILGRDRPVHAGGEEAEEQ